MGIERAKAQLSCTAYLIPAALRRLASDPSKRGSRADDTARRLRSIEDAPVRLVMIERPTPTETSLLHGAGACTKLALTAADMFRVEELRYLSSRGLTIEDSSARAEKPVVMAVRNSSNGWWTVAGVMAPLTTDGTTHTVFRDWMMQSANDPSSIIHFDGFNGDVLYIHGDKAFD